MEPWFRPYDVGIAARPTPARSSRVPALPLHSYNRSFHVLRTWMDYTTGMEHSPTSATGTAWERTPWHAAQQAAWEALRKTEDDIQ